MNESTRFFFGRLNKSTGIIITAVAGIILIVLSAIIGGTTGMKQESSQNELEKYISSMEKRLCDTVSQINGAGESQVFITVENTFETVYASNASIDESGDEKKTSKTTQKQIAYSSAGTDGEMPVVIKQICPKICGVLVVCEGGGDTAVRQEVINSVSTAVGVSTNKIYVTGGRN